MITSNSVMPSIMTRSDKYQAVYQFKFKRLASTNSFLKDIAGFTNHPVTCVADCQTQGYGQQNRNWASQENDIAMSLMLPIPHIDNSIRLPDGLSQRVALAIAEALAEHSHQNIQLKWPNDIFINNAKVGGILIELERAASGQWLIIIGLGVNLQPPIQPPLQHPDSSYKRGWFIPNTSRNQLIGSIEAHLIKTLFTSAKITSAPLNVNAWQARDIFTQGETIYVVSTQNKPQIAYYQGINLQGEAMVYYAHQPNKLVRLNSGTVSLRIYETNKDGTN